MHTVTLTPPARSSPGTSILIGPGALSAAGTYGKGSERVVMVFDEGIRYIAEKIAIQDCIRISVKSGDASKSLTEVDRIVCLMLDAGCTRNTLLLCVGGGMITDLGGFVANVFMRGIQCVLVPTTLLAMVDAAIGGKTAVNAGSKKNMIGTIKHPVSVLIDTELLKALPDAQLAEGLAEVIKIAAMLDRPFFEWLERVMPQLLEREPGSLEECLLRSVSAKVKVVQADEHDRLERLLLNFGHTVGHAVEALSAYKISHGNCVSIGMAAEMKLAGFSDRDRITELCRRVGLPLEIPATMTLPDLWSIMQSDKKNENGTVKIAVPERLGEGSVQTLLQENFFTLRE